MALNEYSKDIGSSICTSELPKIGTQLDMDPQCEDHSNFEPWPPPTQFPCQGCKDRIRVSLDVASKKKKMSYLCTGCEWEGLLSLSLHGIFNALKIESSEEVIIITSVDYCQHPGDWTDEMILKHNSSPLLLTVTCMCFSGVERSAQKITFLQQSTPVLSRLEKLPRVTERSAARASSLSWASVFLKTMMCALAPPVSNSVLTILVEWCAPVTPATATTASATETERSPTV
ncbi:hypothetical protein E3U43_005895 [Larimichthys crocea]|uniref:Uncharacterized protein n=1 Tax=Larimichthys crocea TaxID=215358 RepID=A0ACD3QMK8_LARCR|nr:hypothetical protein E3U43_005895 [Larimichthys crocea]